MSANVKAGWHTSEGQLHAAVMVANLAASVSGTIHPAWVGLLIGAAQASVYAVARAHVKGKAFDAGDLAVAAGAAFTSAKESGLLSSDIAALFDAASGTVDAPPLTGH